MKRTLDDLEYNKLTKKLDFFDSTRNSLLTFSFTSVMAVLGIALQMDMTIQNCWICLIPYFLIIPFSARISYYRFSGAHISTFLRVFASDKMQFELGTKHVKEGRGITFKLIAWLVNHEMVLLGTASSAIFYFKYIPAVVNWTYWAYIGLAIPFVLILIVFVIADSAYNIGKVNAKYMEEWMQAYEGKDN